MFGEPNSGPEDGNRKKKSDDVENADQVITQTKHCENKNLGTGTKKVKKISSFREKKRSP